MKHLGIFHSVLGKLQTIYSKTQMSAKYSSGYDAFMVTSKFADTQLNQQTTNK